MYLRALGPDHEHRVTGVFISCRGLYLLIIPCGCFGLAGEPSKVCTQHSLHVVQDGALLHLHCAVCLAIVHHQLTLLT